MRALRELLDTWENWSARETLTRALSRVRTDDARDNLTRALAEAPEVDPLDALRDTAELVALLTGWQWQAVYAARADGADWGRLPMRSEPPSSAPATTTSRLSSGRSVAASPTQTPTARCCERVRE
jgi:hypothetical protein